MATGSAGDQEQLQGDALDRVADRRAPASSTCSMARGSAGDQEQLQGHALDRVADRRAPASSTSSTLPVVASTLAARVRRPEWLDPPLMPVCR